MRTMIKGLSLIFFIFICVCCSSKIEENWKQFRGTNSLGIAPINATPPLELNADKNLAWKINLAGGSSSPCIFGGKIFLTGFNPKDSVLITYCINQKKGTMIWERSVFPDTLENVKQLVGSAATPTPVTDGTFIYVYFGAYGALCYDANGNLQWEHRLPVLYAQYGSNGSPVIHDNLLIINRVERKKPSILALDTKTGKTVWQQPLDVNNTMEMDVSQSTPVIWRNQVIIHHGFELISLSLNDGSVKWKIETASTGNATPIIIDDSLYVNGWYNLGNTSQFDSIPDFNIMIRKYDLNHDNSIDIQKEIPYEFALGKRPELGLSIRDTISPLKLFAGSWDTNKDNILEEKEWKQLKEEWLSWLSDHAVIALKLNSDEESSQPVLLWKESDYVAEVPSLVKIGPRIFMVMNGGNLICIDSRKGSVIFNGRLGAPGSYFSSPLYANGHIYFASYNGIVTVIRPGDKLNIISRSDLREKISASPAALGKTLYIRTDSAFYAFNKL
jgi:outer membrane protein assembly factor BamB